jgi:hypothetical protein
VKRRDQQWGSSQEAEAVSSRRAVERLFNGWQPKAAREDPAVSEEQINGSADRYNPQTSGEAGGVARSKLGTSGLSG